MNESVSWQLSPDRSAILVVADPAGAEGDPFPNGFFFGSETRGYQVQMDSVWDVAPSPDWKWIGFGRAWDTHKGESGEINLVGDVARRTRIDSATIVASSFPSSGMVNSRAMAQAGVIHVPEDPRAAGAADSAAPRLFPIARGWRVRWTTGGALLALGNSPARATDSEGSETWTSLDPKTGAFHGTLPTSSKLAENRFIAGPFLEPAPMTERSATALPVDMQKAPPITIQRGEKKFTVQSERGVITIVEPGTAGASPRVVGAGVALAATAGGRYIVALSPAVQKGDGRFPIEAVIYTVAW